jgi:microsomal dipeptidase-like Zn-dependent dipeptidase
MDIMEAATQPVIFSHSNPKTLRPHGRNITDDQIRACARTGGVVGVTGLGYFLPDRASPAIALADCVIYVRDLVGVDHVGLLAAGRICTALAHEGRFSARIRATRAIADRTRLVGW